MRPLSRLALVAAAMAVLAFLKEPDTTLFWQSLYDVGHAFLFAAIIIAIRGLPGVQRDRTALFITVGLAVSSELLQLAQPGRDASVDDVLRDAAGATACLLLRASRPSGRSAGAPRSRAFSLRMTAAALALAVFVPFLIVCTIYVQRDLAFPTLFRMNGSWWERRLISTGNATVAWPAATAEGSGGATLLLRPATYPGIIFDEPFPDWTGHRTLAVKVRSFADGTVTLTVRIHDRAHNQQFEDRFNRRIPIAPGENHVTIPLDQVRSAPAGREMDMRHIRGIVLFVHDLKTPLRLELGALILE